MGRTGFSTPKITNYNYGMSTGGQRIFASQYQLDVQIASTLSSPMWRARDLLLNRWVTLVLLPTSDSRSVKLLQECQAAAANDRRDVIAILDVIATGHITEDKTGESKSKESYVGIIFEWLDGQSLNQLLIKGGEVMEVDQALQKIGSLANALAHAHSLNIFHGRLRPHNLIFSEGQNVRLSGFGLDSALMGPDSSDGVQEDIKGIGNLLFAMVTGMWPLESVDFLPAAQGVDGSDLVLPSEVHGGIHSGIDQIYRRTQTGGYASMREVINAISVGEVEVVENLQSRVTRFTASSVTWNPETGTNASRLKAIAIAGLAVGVFGWIGWQLLTNNFQSTSPIEQSISSPVPSSEIADPTGTGEPAQISSISTYDPLGDDRENDDLAQFAIDRDVKSAWTTVQYKAADMGKSGVGLILDLGSSLLLTKVEIEFVSTGHIAEIYVSDAAKPDLAIATKVGQTDGTSEISEVIANEPATGRYVLIWLIPDLPRVKSGSFQGGISEITVIR